MKAEPDMRVVNKWVTERRMKRVIQIAEDTLKIPVKGVFISPVLVASDAPIIADILVSLVKDETKGSRIETQATLDAMREAAKEWFKIWLERSAK